jgi:uncharacterized protein
MKNEKITILKVLVGSHAHGLANDKSDKDYRAVYVLPTQDILSLGYKYKGNDWIEGVEDNTAYEIGHFLSLALKCNPTILEVFKAPIIEANNYGRELQRLFTYVWNPQDAFNAFLGYGLNQRKKFLDKKDNRQDKYACAYIRTLIALIELLTNNDFNVKVPDIYQEKLLRYKNGNYDMGEIINESEKLIKIAKLKLQTCHNEQNKDFVNKFLLDIRKQYWRF